ncbi:DUF6777 domain-containing protein [Streptomyces sp. NPDC058664]|uniref:DUF6777 domain-containing protein n=1 Tax=unclassified Streptomyces TaxID=2593676 RepID=UPI00365A336C
MRSVPRRTRRIPTAPHATPRPAARSALAALTASLLLAGCSAAWEGSRGGAQPAAEDAQDVFLQPLAERGPDPFTASTARHTATQPSSGRGQDPNPGAEQVREVTGSTPGLYGGTRAEGSCDVERQVSLLAADQDKTRAFAEAAGIPETNVTGWLRGLTPVVLRADVRVTNHGYRERRPHAFQSVLQTGTAVLVDQYGSPRVRCACGNPLRSPATAPGAVHQGDPWDGFDPDRVITVRPTTTVVTSLVIVNAADRSWIERLIGSHGDKDRKPEVEPACDPDECRLTGSGSPDPTTPDPSAPDRPASPDTPPGTPVPPAPESPASPDASGTGGTDTAPTPTAPDIPPYPDREADPYPDAPPYPDGEADPYPDAPPYPDPDTEPYPDPNADPDVPPFPDPNAEPPGEPPTVPDGELPPEELFPAGPVPEQPETFEG